MNICNIYISLSYIICEGICPACKRSHHQDGCEQPGHGHGSQLSALPVWWPQGDLWEHPQGDVLHPGAHPAAGHQLHGWNSIAPSLFHTLPCFTSSLHDTPFNLLCDRPSHTPSSTGISHIQWCLKVGEPLRTLYISAYISSKTSSDFPLKSWK